MGLALGTPRQFPSGPWHTAPRAGLVSQKLLRRGTTSTGLATVAARARFCVASGVQPRPARARPAVDPIVPSAVAATSQAGGWFVRRLKILHIASWYPMR